MDDTSDHIDCIECHEIRKENQLTHSLNQMKYENNSVTDSYTIFFLRKGNPRKKESAVINKGKITKVMSWIMTKLVKD